MAGTSSGQALQARCPHWEVPVARPKNKYEFKFVILGRYPARLQGNESQLTVNLASGHEGNVTHSGTLTLSEGEWETLLSALQSSLKDAVKVEDLSEFVADWGEAASS